MVTDCQLLAIEFRKLFSLCYGNFIKLKVLHRHCCRAYIAAVNESGRNTHPVYLPSRIVFNFYNSFRKLSFNLPTSLPSSRSYNKVKQLLSGSEHGYRMRMYRTDTR